MAWLFIFACFTFVVWAIVSTKKENRTFREERVTRFTEDTEWENQELAKPRWVVQFEVEDETLRSIKAKPEVWHKGSFGVANKRITSLQRVQWMLEDFYKKGYFIAVDGTTYPACNVIKAKIVEVK